MSGRGLGFDDEGSCILASFVGCGCASPLTTMADAEEVFCLSHSQPANVTEPEPVKLPKPSIPIAEDDTGVAASSTIFHRKNRNRCKQQKFQKCFRRRPRRLDDDSDEDVDSAAL